VKPLSQSNKAVWAWAGALKDVTSPFLLQLAWKSPNLSQYRNATGLICPPYSKHRRQGTMNKISKTALSMAAIVAVAWHTQSPAFAKVQQYEPSLSGNFLAGRVAADARDSEAASAYFADALKQDPGNAQLIERLFQISVAAGDMAQAEKFADDVLAFNSQHRLARIVLGLKALREKKLEEARTHFDEAAYTPVGELTSALLRAWSYAAENSLGAAMKELDKLDANESFANFKSFHAALISDVLNSSVRTDGAYKKAYAEAGTSLRVAQAYGNFLERNGRSKEAVEVYRSFLSGSDGNQLVGEALARAEKGIAPPPFVANAEAGVGEALFSLAAAMNDDQSIDVAQIYAQLAVAMTGDKPVTLTLLGDIQAATRNYQAAIETYEAIPATSVLRTNAETEIAINLQRLEKPAESEQRLRAVIAREPKNYEVLVTLGNLLRNNENYKDAEAIYTQAIDTLAKAERQHWSVYYFRGIARERLKTWPGAEADFRKALELSPDEPSVLNYLGYSLIDMNLKLDEAIAMVKKAVEAKPNDGYIVDSLGWAHFRLGDYEEAVVHLERAVDLRAGDAIIAEHLGDAYWRVGRKLEAKFQWQHAKDNKPEPDDLKRIEGKLKDGLPDLPPPVKPADNSKAGGNNG
jgi:tetratricopeptide (TPR) repeat protein